MFNSIRRSLSTTALTMTPFLLSACGPDNPDNKRVAMVVVLGLTFTVTLVADLLKTAHSAPAQV